MLRNCPFCGKQPRLMYSYEDKWVVVCDCGAALRADEKRAVQFKWNTRMKPPLELGEMRSVSHGKYVIEVEIGDEI